MRGEREEVLPRREVNHLFHTDTSSVQSSRAEGGKKERKGEWERGEEEEEEEVDSKGRGRQTWIDSEEKATL